MDTNNNPTFNLLNLSEPFGAHVNVVFKTAFELERKKIAQLIFSLNCGIFPLAIVKSKRR